MVKEYSLKKDGDKFITRNFKIKEFRCKDGSDKILIDIDFVKDKLQKIRDWCGGSVSITSGYRTESYNKKVGGAAHSYHMKGQAFDIVVSGKTLDEVCRYAESLGILGIIKYPNSGFVHVDSRSSKYFSNDSGKTACTSFGSSSIRPGHPIYLIGKNYECKKNLHVRKGPGVVYPALKHIELTSNGQNSDKNKDGTIDSGTIITVLDQRVVGSDVWVKIPSGWIAAYYQGEFYVI